MITFNDFAMTCKTPNAAAAMYRLLSVQFENWKSEMLEIQLDHIEGLKADVLDERQYSSTIYSGWGTTVDNAISELWQLESCRLELDGCTIKTVWPE